MDLHNVVATSSGISMVTSRSFMINTHLIGDIFSLVKF